MDVSYPSGGEWDSLVGATQDGHVFPALLATEASRQGLDKLSYKFPMSELQCTEKYKLDPEEVLVMIARNQIIGKPLIVLCVNVTLLNMCEKSSAKVPTSVLYYI